MDEWLMEIIELSKSQTRLWKIVCIILTVILIMSNAGWLLFYNGKEINHADNTDPVATNMVISDYITTELEYFRTHCNFTDLERAVFDRRSKGMSLEDISEELGYSYDYIRRISVKVNRKILKAI